jgi:hypothetical protein
MALSKSVARPSLSSSDMATRPSSSIHSSHSSARPNHRRAESPQASRGSIVAGQKESEQIENLGGMEDGKGREMCEMGAAKGLEKSVQTGSFSHSHTNSLCFTHNPSIPLSIS